MSDERSPNATESPVLPDHPQKLYTRRRFLKDATVLSAGVAISSLTPMKILAALAAPPPAEAIVVDEDNGVGRVILEGPPQYWWLRDEPTCMGGQMRYTHNTPTPGPVRMNWATWETPPLPVTGGYTIVVYIPLENASTSCATYQIRDGNNQVLTYEVDQSTNRGKWVEIGVNVQYAAGQLGAVYVDDVVPEAPGARWVDIGVDAMVWLPPGVDWNPGPNLIPYDPRRAQLGLPPWCGIAGEPVATSLGYFYTQHRDVFVPGPGLSMDFTRAYSSLNTKQGLFGRGWTCQFDMSAQDRGNGEIIITLANGRAGLYVPNGGSYTRPDGFLAELQKEGNGWILTEVDQTRYTFDQRGKLRQIVDVNHNTVNIDYDLDDFTIIDAVGREFVVELNGDGYVKTITDPLGRRFTFIYDGDRLTQFTNAENGSIQYAYDAEKRLTSITDPNHHTFVFNEYDSEGRVIAQIDASGSVSTFAYETSPRRTTFTDNLGHQTIYEFDDQYRLIKETDHLGRSMIYGYDSDNNRNYIKDREGHETYMEYDERGNLKKVTDALNQDTVFEYNALNKMTFKRDAAGAETHYVYDGLGFNLIRTLDPEGGETEMDYYGSGLLKTLTNPNGQITQFTYDAYGNPETVTDALTNVTHFVYDIAGRRREMTDANGHTVEFDYDNNDRVTVATDPKGRTTKFIYDPVGNLKRVTDRRGYATLYDYNENDSLIKVTDPRGFFSAFTYDLQYHRKTAANRRNFTTTYDYDEVYDLRKVTDAKGYATQFEYDADRNLKKVVDAKGGVTTYEYDLLHRLKKMVDALNGETRYEYDPVGRVKNRRDPNTAFTQYEYDQLGRLKTVIDALDNPTEFTYDPVGNRLTAKNARGFTTTYHYNAINQLVEQIDPLTHSTHWTYNGVGNVLTLTDRRGNTTTFEYDENDNLRQITDALNGVATFEYDEEDHRTTATDQNGHPKRFAYDEAGNLKSVQLPRGQITQFAYDGNGNRIAVTNAKNNTTHFEYDELDLPIARLTPLAFATRYQYDELRRMIKQIDAEGNPTEYQYDPLGRMTAVIDALNNVTRYEYDPVGNLLKQIDANSHTTRFDVDLLGRVIGETNPVSNVWGYQFDAVGNRVQRTDANSKLTQYEFDADNRLARIVYPNGTDVKFEYDENDNLIAVADLSGRATFAYDKLNRLTRSRRAERILKDKAIGYEYDSVGNRKKVIYPDSQAVLYDYDDNDWLAAVADPVTGIATQYTRDDIGLPTRLANPNATWTDYEYDADDRLIKLFNGKPQASTNIISAYEYALDKVGNRTRIIEQATRGQAVTWTKDYAYDKIYRLKKAVETPSAKPYQVLTSEFEYDPVGNRLLQKTNIADKPNTPALPAPVTTQYAYDTANRLLTAGATTIAYDKNGNRTAMSGTERAIDYAYDFENRLIGAHTYDVSKNKRNADATLDFAYDGLGRRLERGVSEKGVRKTADFLYDGLGYDMLAQYVDPGSPRTSYYYRDPLQVLSRHETQSEGAGAGLQYFHHYDGLSSVSAWTNQAGREVQEYAYAPYGRLIDNNGADNSSNRTDPHNALSFSGKLWDKELETYYFGARDYDPAMGVWLTQDPYRGRLMEPMTLHRYGYVGGNPINLVDRYGFSDEQFMD